MAQWRRFSFFEKQSVKDENSKPWLRGLNITAMGASRGTLVLGDAYGALHLVDSQLKMNKFQAYEHFVSHVKMVRMYSITNVEQ